MAHELGLDSDKGERLVSFLQNLGLGAVQLGQHGTILALEGHVNHVISTPERLRRLLEQFPLRDFGMGMLSTPLLSKTLEEVTHDDVGIASGIYTTVQQLAGAFGVALLGPLDAFLTTSIGNSLRAFVITMLVIVLLSLGLWFSVLPFGGSLHHKSR